MHIILVKTFVLMDKTLIAWDNHSFSRCSLEGSEGDP